MLGRCNNCWKLTEADKCPDCGCMVFHVPQRFTKVICGTMANCRKCENRPSLADNIGEKINILDLEG